MTQGGKFCGLRTFVKFGGKATFHHNMRLPLETLSIAISFSTLASASLPFPDLDGQDVPLQIIGDAIGYIIFWPWKLTTTYI
jgi:hypothetical protein